MEITQRSAIIKNIEARLQENWSVFYLKMKKKVEISEYLEEALDDFRKYNLGSLSFTITNMRHVGYDYPYAIMESVEAGLILYNKNNKHKEV